MTLDTHNNNKMDLTMQYELTEGFTPVDDIIRELLES